MNAKARGAFSPVVLALALWGCGGDGHDDGDGHDGPPDDTSTVPLPCDIREAVCQRSVFQETARLREQTGATMPPIRLITRAQYADETRSSVSNSPPSRSGQIMQGVLRLLRFLPADTSVGQAAAESSIEGVAAYYHKRDKNVTIIDDAATDKLSGTYTLSHEFVHALQDQREDLDLLDKQAKSADEALAVDCLVEGEAVVLSDVLLVQLRDGVSARPNFPAYFDRMLTGFLTQIEKSDAPLTLSLMTLPYPVGGRPLATAFTTQGTAGIQGFYRARPTSMVAWVDTGRKPLSLGCGLADAPVGYKLFGVDRLGGAGLISLYTRLGLDGSDAFDAASAWVNDSFGIYATPDDQPVASAFAWRIGLSDTASALALEAKVNAAMLPQVAVSRSDEQVVITGATDPAALTAWTNRDACVASKSRSDAPTERIIPKPFGDQVFQRAHHPATGHLHGASFVVPRAGFEPANRLR